MYENCLIVFLACTAAAQHMTGPSTYTARVGSIAHIPCTFTADTLPADPSFFVLLWYFDEKSIISFDNTMKSTDPRYSLDKDRALHGNADLIISNVSVSDAGDYTCYVIYSPVRIQRKIKVDITATPTITIVNKVITKNIKSNLNSTISGFYPVDIDIKWLRDGQTLDNVTIEKPQKNPDGTYSVNSSVIITPTEEDRERIFSCRVQHESLITPLQEDFRLLYSVQPQVTILTKSVQINTENTLACMVTGFFPPDINVTWYKDGEVLNDQLMGEPHKNDNGTYQVISMVTITPSDDDENRNFSCRVQHISLQEPLQESFILQDSSTLIVFRISLLLCSVCLVNIVTSMLKQLHRKKDSSCYAINVLDKVELLVYLVILVCLVILVTILIHWRKDSSFYSIYIIGIAIVVILLCSVPLVTIAINMWNQIHRRKEQLPDLEVGEITVPELIAGKNATLLCKLYHYIPGKHICSWYVKVKSGDEIHIDYDKRKIQMTNKDETSDDQNTFITYLGLVPVEESDDGSEFILRVNLPDRVIERSSGAVHVKANPQRLTSKDRQKNNPVHKDTWGWNTAALTATHSSSFNLEQSDEEENAECRLFIDLDHKGKILRVQSLTNLTTSLTPPY